MATPLSLRNSANNVANSVSRGLIPRTPSSSSRSIAVLREAGPPLQENERESEQTIRHLLKSSDQKDEKLSMKVYYLQELSLAVEAAKNTKRLKLLEQRANNLQEDNNNFEDIGDDSSTGNCRKERRKDHRKGTGKSSNNGTEDIFSNEPFKQNQFQIKTDPNLRFQATKDVYLDKRYQKLRREVLDNISELGPAQLVSLACSFARMKYQDKTAWKLLCKQVEIQVFGKEGVSKMLVKIGKRRKLTWTRLPGQDSFMRMLANHRKILENNIGTMGKRNPVVHIANNIKSDFIPTDYSQDINQIPSSILDRYASNLASAKNLVTMRNRFGGLEEYIDVSGDDCGTGNGGNNGSGRKILNATSDPSVLSGPERRRRGIMGWEERKAKRRGKLTKDGKIIGKDLIPVKEIIISNSIDTHKSALSHSQISLILHSIAKTNISMKNGFISRMIRHMIRDSGEWNEMDCLWILNLMRKRRLKPINRRIRYHASWWKALYHICLRLTQKINFISGKSMIMSLSELSKIGFYPRKYIEVAIPRLRKMILVESSQEQNLIMENQQKDRNNDKDRESSSNPSNASVVQQNSLLSSSLLPSSPLVIGSDTYLLKLINMKKKIRRIQQHEEEVYNFNNKKFLKNVDDNKRLLLRLLKKSSIIDLEINRVKSQYTMGILNPQKFIIGDFVNDKLLMELSQALAKLEYFDAKLMQIIAASTLRLSDISDTAFTAIFYSFAKLKYRHIPLIEFSIDRTKKLCQISIENLKYQQQRDENGYQIRGYETTKILPSYALRKYRLSDRNFVLLSYSFGVLKIRNRFGENGRRNGEMWNILSTLFLMRLEDLSPLQIAIFMKSLGEIGHYPNITTTVDYCSSKIEDKIVATDFFTIFQKKMLNLDDENLDNYENLDKDTSEINEIRLKKERPLSSKNIPTGILSGFSSRQLIMVLDSMLILGKGTKEIATTRYEKRRRQERSLEVGDELELKYGGIINSKKSKMKNKMKNSEWEKDEHSNNSTDYIRPIVTLNPEFLRLVIMLYIDQTQHRKMACRQLASQLGRIVFSLALEHKDVMEKMPKSVIVLLEKYGGVRCQFRSPIAGIKALEGEGKETEGKMMEELGVMNSSDAVLWDTRSTDDLRDGRRTDDMNRCEIEKTENQVEEENSNDCKKKNLYDQVYGNLYGYVPPKIPSDAELQRHYVPKNPMENIKISDSKKIKEEWRNGQDITKKESTYKDIKMMRELLKSSGTMYENLFEYLLYFSKTEKIKWKKIEEKIQEKNFDDGLSIMSKKSPIISKDELQKALILSKSKMIDLQSYKFNTERGPFGMDVELKLKNLTIGIDFLGESDYCPLSGEYTGFVRFKKRILNHSINATTTTGNYSRGTKYLYVPLKRRDFESKDFKEQVDVLMGVCRKMGRKYGRA